MDALFDGNPAPYYDFDSGDCYILLAQAYLAMGERERAMDCVEKAIDNCIARLEPDREHISLFIRQSKINWAFTPVSREVVRVKCMEKLASPEIAPLKGDARFTALQKGSKNYKRNKNLMRIPKSLHKSLAEHSKTEGICRNQYCLFLLTKNDASFHTNA